MNGSVVIITGASSGIGAATARLLADQHRLVLIARRRDRLADVVEAIRVGGGVAHSIAVDITEDGAVERIIEESVDRFGAINAVINNAGIFRTSPNAG